MNIYTWVGYGMAAVFLALLIAAAVVLVRGLVIWLNSTEDEDRVVGGRVAGYLACAAFLVVYPIGLGFTLAGRTTRTTGWEIQYVYLQIIIVFGIVPLIAVSVLRRFRPVVTGFVLVYVFALLLEIFSALYWAYGTKKNFNIPLSHLDAFYFALGTLTTAGTGNIVAKSETSRWIQTVQLGLDLLLVGFIVALVMARYSALFNGAKRVLPPGSAPVPEPPTLGDSSEQPPDASESNDLPADHPRNDHGVPEETADTKPPPHHPDPPGVPDQPG